MLERLNQELSKFLSNGVYRLIFTFVFAVLLSFSTPAWGQAWIAWIGLLPYLLLIKSSKNFLETTVDSFIFFLVYYLLSFSWLLGLYPLSWHGFDLNQSFFITALAWILPSIFHSLVLIVFGLISKAFFNYRTKARSKELKVLDIFILSFLWVILVHKLSLNGSSFFSVFLIPINFLAYSQYQNIYLIQISKIIGSIGLEFFIILVNIWLSNLFNVSSLKTSSSNTFHNYSINQKFSGIENIRYEVFFGFGILLSFFLIFSYGFLELNFFNKTINKKISVGILQSALPSSETRSIKHDLSIDEIVKYNLDLSLNKTNGLYDLLLWPEGSIPSVNYENLELFSKISKSTKAFIYGTYSLDNSTKKLYNSIAFKEFILEENGTSLKSNFYHKKRLVPFGEYTPFLSLIPNDLKDLAKSAVGSGFDKGSTNQNPIDILGFKIGPSICFELLFPDLIREQVLKGAEVLINLNDLSWFKNDFISRNFLAAGVFRAVENKRDLLLVSNQNYASHIDSFGRIVSIIKNPKPDFFESEVELKDKLSVYTAYGW